MPPFRPRTTPPDRQRAARGIADALAEPRIPGDMRSIIRDAGGTREAARLVGRSERTIQRWMAGQVEHIPDQLRGTLARAGTAGRTRQLIADLGGARAMAAITGRSVRTVQRWANGEIARPRPDARRRLGRADAANRMRQRGLTINPATGQPGAPIYLQLTGAIRVVSSPSKEYSYPSRSIGIGGMNPQGVQISADTMAAVTDALGRSDYAGVRSALEEFLSTEYAATGSYNPSAGVGLFIDSIDSITFNQDNLSEGASQGDAEAGGDAGPESTPTLF